MAGATTSYAGGTALSLVAQWCHAPGLVLRGVWERACAWFLGNVARNSPVTTSKLEIIALELQRFGGVWVFRTVCFERVVLSSPGCLWPGRMDDHEEVLEAHA